MSNVGHMELPTPALDEIDKFDFPPLEFQSAMVDSMSPPHVAEYASAQHALALDSASLQLINDDIDECRVLIARAHARMRVLERQRDIVQRRVSIHRARLSPLRTVPDQILQEIFQHCLPDTPYGVVPDVRTAPMVLTHVCRRWRTVAQGTSELWSSIALCDRGVWNYELKVEMAKRWLDRTHIRPIRLSITCPPHTDFGVGGSPSCSDVFRLAITHSTQLRDVYLNVNKAYLRHFMDCARFPALRSVVVSLHTVNRIDETPELTSSSLVSAPSLRRIAFKGNGMSIDLVPRTFFPQITHLSFDCNMTLDLALLFQDFPNLEHLALALSLSRDALRFRLPSTPPFPSPPQTTLNEVHNPIVSRSLAYLEVRLDADMLEFGDPHKLEAVLDPLDLPHLETLVFVAPLRPRFDERTRRSKASWENHAAWVRSRSVTGLLSRSRQARARVETWDLAAGMGTGTSSQQHQQQVLRMSEAWARI